MNEITYTVTIKFDTGTIVVAVLFLITGYFLGNVFQIGGTSVTGQAVQTSPIQLPQAPQAQTQPSRVQVSTDGEPYLGSKNAKVVVVEFDDFQCPFCKRFKEQTEPQIKTEYIDAGKILFVHKDFPLPFHTEADEMQEAAQCAFEQGNEQFWKFRDLVFSKQADWAGKTNAFDLAKQYATEISGLDANKFNSCVDSAKYRSEVQGDIQEGSTAGVSGTPTFYINGLELVGAQPFSAFKQIIDAELAA